MQIMKKFVIFILFICNTVTAADMEKNYLNEITFPVTRKNYVVLSGCSGGGKSTLLAALAEKGYRVMCEPGRQIVKEQQAIKGDALPWVNIEKFLELALSRYLYLYNSQEPTDEIIFFDRSIIDAVQLGQKQPDYFHNAATNFRYNNTVFLVPPWKEIFANDPERAHSFEAAKREFDELVIKYKMYGYETVLIPKASVNERVEFIIKRNGNNVTCNE